MNFYILFHRPEGDTISAYIVPNQAVAQASAEALGYSFEFITEAEYQTRLAALEA